MNDKRSFVGMENEEIQSNRNALFPNIQKDSNIMDDEEVNNAEIETYNEDEEYVEMSDQTLHNNNNQNENDLKFNNNSNEEFDMDYDDDRKYDSDSSHKRIRRNGTLKNKYEDIFSLSEGQEKLVLDKININGRFYYSMWQLKQKLSERMPLDVSRKNKLRYIIQNRTKKDNPENVIKLLTRPAKEEMELGKHLLTPNKYSTFISVDEFQEGGSFGFISTIIQDYTEDSGKVYRTTHKSLGKAVDNNLSSSQLPLKQFDLSPTYEQNNAYNNNNNNNSQTQYPLQRNAIMTNLFNSNNINISNNNNFPVSTPISPSPIISGANSFSQLNSTSFINTNNPIKLSSNIVIPPLKNLEIKTGSILNENKNFKLKSINNIININKTNNENNIFIPNNNNNTNFHYDCGPPTSNTNFFVDKFNLQKNNDNQIHQYNNLPTMLTPSPLVDTKNYTDTNSLQSSDDETDEKEREKAREGEETFEVVNLLCRLNPENSPPNNKRTLESSKSSSGSRDISKKLKTIKNNNNNSPSISIFGNVPVRIFNSKGSIYSCTVNGNELSFITSIDFKNILIEQLEIKDKNKINSIAQSIENALSSESPRFDITTYNTYFEFTGRNNYTRILILNPNKIVKQKYHIYRDNQNNRWLLKMLKNYKYINHSTIFVINDVQLEKKIYAGPTEKILSLMENIGNLSQGTGGNNDDESDPFIDVLVFKESNENGKVTKDICISNQKLILNIYGQNLTKQQYTSLVFCIAPSPKSYSSVDFVDIIYSFGEIQFISSSCLQNFISSLRIDNLIDELYSKELIPSIQISNTSIKPFFLMAICIPGKFQLKLISKSHSIWHLYLYSIDKVIIIDCSNFKKEKITENSQNIDSIYKKISHLHQSAPGFISRYLSSSSNQSQDLPPLYSTQLISNPFKINEKNIQDIFVPPLKSGIYNLWITYFIGWNPVESYSKEFRVDDII